MMVMIIAVLVVLGLCLGSFVNALVWRTHELEEGNVTDKKQRETLSVSRGRSMCPDCRHVLKVADLVPVLSWLALRGKCRYCKKPISVQYPLVELVTAGLFAASYIWWPAAFDDSPQTAIFSLWLVLLTGLMTLHVYDLKWSILPTRIIHFLTPVALLIALIQIGSSGHVVTAFLNAVGAVAVGGGIFYLLFEVSGGKWIGGGDVRLGVLLGLVAGTPARSLMFIFIASVLGTVISLPLLFSKRLKRGSTIPFGPLLIIGLVIVQLFGADIMDWYRHTFLLV